MDDSKSHGQAATQNTTRLPKPKGWARFFFFLFFVLCNLFLLIFLCFFLFVFFNLKSLTYRHSDCQEV